LFRHMFLHCLLQYLSEWQLMFII